MEQQIDNYTQAISLIKNAILKSRYMAAKTVNREQLSLYYGIGRYISENSRNGFWGTNNHFVSIGFTHHIAIINAVKEIEERLFYIERCAAEFWSVEKLKYNLKSNLYSKQGTTPR